MIVSLRAFLLALLLLLLPIAPAGAQGCAQCRDSAQATPPKTQTAYREAILLLGGAAVLLCGTGAAVIWRSERP